MRRPVGVGETNFNRRPLWSAMRYGRLWPMLLKNSLEKRALGGYAESKAFDGEQRG